MTDYLSVTELSGDEVSQEQVERLCNRYFWAGQYCRGKDIIEAACGTGQGLGYLSRLSKSLVGGDYSNEILKRAKSHYGDRVVLKQFDAQEMPFSDNSADVIILFEAIYYIPSVEKFLKECRRILRNNGKVLIATANRDLPDFNPSPYSHQYFGVVELGRIFAAHGFSTEFFGDTPVTSLTLRQKILRPVKKLAVKFGLIPKTMGGKKLLKRLVFGGLIKMPPEIAEGMCLYRPPTPLAISHPDRIHKVIYCAATLQKN